MDKKIKENMADFWSFGLRLGFARSGRSECRITYLPGLPNRLCIFAPIHRARQAIERFLRWFDYPKHLPSAGVAQRTPEVQQGICKQALWYVEGTVRVLVSDCYNECQQQGKGTSTQIEQNQPIHDESPCELR